MKSILEFINKFTIINDEIYYIGNKFTVNNSNFLIKEITNDGIVSYLHLETNVIITFDPKRGAIWNEHIVKVI